MLNFIVFTDMGIIECIVYERNSNSDNDNGNYDDDNNNPSYL